ncbi:MAG: hypothetical protein ACPL0A_03525, partial [Candidatus Micrarchaeia archaeon]
FTNCFVQKQLFKHLFHMWCTYAQKKELREREVDLARIEANSKLKIMAITGIRRSGKSSLLILLYQRLKKDMLGIVEKTTVGIDKIERDPNDCLKYVGFPEAVLEENRTEKINLLNAYLKDIPKNQEINYWKSKEGREVDFVIRDGSITEQIIQVAYGLVDDKTKEIEYILLWRWLLGTK